MKTITIPMQEYLELLDLYKKISEKIHSIKAYENQTPTQKPFDAHKYCGSMKLTEDALQIQKDMRDEWD